MTDPERLKTVEHLIGSSEHTFQALGRVVEFLKIEFPTLRRVETYIVSGSKLDPGPAAGSQGNGRTGGRELALRAAFSGDAAKEKDQLALPIKSAGEVVGVLALKSDQPDTDFSEIQQDFLTRVAGLCSILFE